MLPRLAPQSEYGGGKAGQAAVASGQGKGRQPPNSCRICWSTQHWARAQKEQWFTKSKGKYGKNGQRKGKNGEKGVNGIEEYDEGRGWADAEWAEYEGAEKAEGKDAKPDSEECRAIWDWSEEGSTDNFGVFAIEATDAVHDEQGAWQHIPHSYPSIMFTITPLMSSSS